MKQALVSMLICLNLYSVYLVNFIFLHWFFRNSYAKIEKMFENIGSLNENKTQSGNAKRISFITDSGTTTSYCDTACFEDDKHSLSQSPV